MRAARRARHEGPSAPPLGLRVYGAIITSLNAIGCLVLVTAFLVSGVGDGSALLGAFVYGLFTAVGVGLAMGKRVAVVGLGVLLGLILLMILPLFMRHPEGLAVVILVLVLLYGVPVAIGIVRWKRLT